MKKTTVKTVASVTLITALGSTGYLAANGAPPVAAAPNAAAVQKLDAQTHYSDEDLKWDSSDEEAIDLANPAATDGQSRTVVLAERADAGWSAKLNDSPLDPIDVQDATGSWRQAFSMPPGGGELVVSHQSTAGTVAARLIWAAWAITVLAALPLRRRRTIA